MSLKTPVQRLRRVIADMEAKPAPTDDDVWFARASRRYLENASDGLTLDQALGLAPAQGEQSWWRREALDRRDTAVRELAGRHLHGMSPAAQAREIESLLRRYASTRWLRSDQYAGGTQPTEYEGRREWWLFEIMATGCGDIGERTLRAVLSKEIPGNRPRDPIAKQILESDQDSGEEDAA